MRICIAYYIYRMRWLNWKHAVAVLRTTCPVVGLTLNPYEHNHTLYSFRLSLFVVVTDTRHGVRGRSHI